MLCIAQYMLLFRPATAGCTPKFFRLDVRTPTCLSLSKTLPTTLVTWQSEIEQTVCNCIHPRLICSDINITINIVYSTQSNSSLNVRISILHQCLKPTDLSRPKRSVIIAGSFSHVLPQFIDVVFHFFLCVCICISMFFLIFFGIHCHYSFTVWTVMHVRLLLAFSNK